MGTRYRDYNPEQTFLLPPSPSDWLPEEHLAYFIADTLDLRGFHKRYERDGRHNRPYHPAMLLKVLVYAYTTGIFSSRKIARKIDEDVALRVLAAGNRPDFRTINRFRGEHLKEFNQLFIEIVRLAKRSGLLKLGTVALDGTKVNANASKHKAMSYKRMQEDEVRLLAEIAELIEHAERIDAAEDEQYGETRGDEIPGRQGFAKRKQRWKPSKRRRTGPRAVGPTMSRWRAASGHREAARNTSGGGRRRAVDRGDGAGLERGRQWLSDRVVGRGEGQHGREAEASVGARDIRASRILRN